MTSLAAFAVLASELPDPGRPATIALASLLGGFCGGVVGRARREPRERVKDLTADGAFVGCGVGLACWLVAFAIDRL
jgi:hypothetical protein